MDRYPNHSDNDRIAFIGNYLPRQCGIATFTTDLCEAVAVEHPGATCIALPVNDIEAGYAVPVTGCVSSWPRRTSTLIAAPLTS